jgi:predicted Zn-dependent peptidase
MYKKVKFDNGLKLIAHFMPNMQSAALGIWIRAGGRYESNHNKGISHLLEHLLFKGSKKYSCRKIKESLEGVGGSLNGFTSEEFTCFLVKIPAAHLKLALDVLSDMVINPLLFEAEILKEKQVILEEIKMYRDLPQSYVYELLDELLWPNQPLGAPVIGNVETVSAISRESLLDFKRRYYTPANIVISATGSLSHDRLIKGVAKNFPGTKRQEANVFLAAEEKQGRAGLRISLKDTEQTHMALGFHGLARDHSLRHALGILHVILGANMSSRLFNEIREKRGLAYEIGTQVKRFQDTGAFIVHAGIDNRKVTEALALILDQLNKTKEKLVSEDEFKRAKDFYMGQLLLALEDTLDYMLWIGESTISLDKAYVLSDIIKELKALKREDVRKVAQYLFQDKKINLALIGPLKGKEEDIRQRLLLG